MPKKENISQLIGLKYGRLTIMADSGIFNEKRMIIAKCECGSLKEYALVSVRKGSTKSCGCIKYKEADFVGRKFGKLTIISGLGTLNGKRRVLVKCECGVIQESYLKEIKSADKKSCGCGSRSKDGLSKHPIHISWRNMISRCEDPDCTSYDAYGGSGVSVCDEWRNDFMSFYSWAIDKWQDGLQLDKDKICGGEGKLYSPELCCFLTPSENSRNRKSNLMVEYNGELKCLTGWCEKLNLPYFPIRKRIYLRGWTVERAFSEPLRKTKSA
jgi:hypothetical protein